MRAWIADQARQSSRIRVVQLRDADNFRENFGAISGAARCAGRPGSVAQALLTAGPVAVFWAVVHDMY